MAPPKYDRSKVFSNAPAARGSQAPPSADVESATSAARGLDPASPGAVRQVGAVFGNSFVQGMLAADTTSATQRDRVSPEHVQLLRASGFAEQAAALSPQDTATRGLAGGGGALPHAEQIQSSFGSFDVGGVQAHVGGPARRACADLGAEAFASGDRVAFAETPSLHTAAHEAAHVVQQRAGVSLSGGLGRAGDAYEQQADAVADAVVQGRSSEGLLRAGGGGGGQPAVQRHEAPASSAVNNEEALTMVSASSASSLIAAIEEYAEESVFDDDEVEECMAKLAAFGDVQSHAIVAKLGAKAQEEMVDNINPVHLSRMSLVLEVFHAASGYLDAWVDMDVLEAIPAARLGGRQLWLFQGIVNALGSSKREDLLESDNGAAIGRAIGAAAGYDEVDDSHDQAAVLKERIWPDIVGELKRSTNGQRALEIIEGSGIEIDWAFMKGARVEFNKEGEMMSLVIGVRDQNPLGASQYLIHEAMHIEEGRTMVPSDFKEKEEFVDAMCYEEADGTIRAAQATMEKDDAHRRGMMPLEEAYIHFLETSNNDLTYARDELMKYMKTGNSKEYMAGTQPIGAYGPGYRREYEKHEAEKASP